ncbi:DUF5681 domain-containing protein [Ralstonia flatus]|uniref:DUF5681 domain-containing protein n=1 Tax=Ralstonia flatus TaxID=3058601 RepID=UPI0039777830
MTDTPARLPSGRFAPGQSGNPTGRRPTVEAVRRLLEPRREELVKKCVAMALAGDTVAMRLCLERIAPVPRSETPPVEVPGLAQATSSTERGDAILAAVGNGHISVDAARQLLGALADYLKIRETDELARRLAALEIGDLL